MVGNLSRGRCLQQVQAPQERGLSGTGRADDTGNIPAADRKINILKNQVGAKGLAQMTDF